MKLKLNKNIPVNKIPESDDFAGEYYQTFREELTPILLRFFPKVAERNTPILILLGHHRPDTKTRPRYHTQKEMTEQIRMNYTS